MTLGDRLKLARENKGYTQVYVRERTKINNKTLSGYENGVSEPDSQTLSILADIYGVSVDWLYGRDKTNQAMLWTKQDEKLLDDFNSLSEEDQAYILRFIETMKKSSQ